MVHNVLYLERLDDVRDKLGVDVSLADTFMQQLPDGALVLGADLLWLVAHIQHRRGAYTNTLSLIPNAFLRKSVIQRRSSKDFQIRTSRKYSNSRRMERNDNTCSLY